MGEGRKISLYVNSRKIAVALKKLSAETGVSMMDLVELSLTHTLSLAEALTGTCVALPHSSPPALLNATREVSPRYEAALQFHSLRLAPHLEHAGAAW